VRSPVVELATSEPRPDVAHYRFYEKVIKVKDDVAAFLIFISQMFSLPH
jgi:hypothetical protein